MGGAELAVRTGVEDATLRSNIIGQQSNRADNYFNRVGKTAEMMADVGATIGKYLEEKSYRDEATALAPLKALTSAFGYGRISQGDFRGFGDIAASTSIGASNPLLARMDQSATVTANSIANNYLTTTLAAQDKAFREKLYGLQQGGREDILTSRQDVTRQNNQVALERGQSLGLFGGEGGVGGGGGGGGAGGEQAPEASVEPPLPTDDNGGIAPDQPPGELLPPLQGTAPQPQGQPQQATTITLDENDQVVNSEINWQDREGVKKVLAAIPERQAGRILGNALRNNDISEQDLQEYGGALTDASPEQARARQQGQEQIAKYLAENPMPTAMHAQLLADKAGFDTLSVTPKQAETTAVLIAFPAIENKGKKISTTEHAEVAGTTSGSGVSTRESSGKSSTMTLDDSGLPEGIKQAAKDYTDNIVTVSSDAKPAEWIKLKGGLFNDTISVVPASGGDENIPSEGYGFNLYVNEGGEQKFYADKDGNPITVSKKYGEAVQGVLSSIQTMKNNSQASGQPMFFLRIQNKDKTFKDEYSDEVDEKTKETYGDILGADALNQIAKTTKDQKGRADAAQALKDKLVTDRLPQIVAISKQKGATKEDVDRANKAKTVATEIINRQKFDLQKQVDRLKSKDTLPNTTGKGISLTAFQLPRGNEVSKINSRNAEIISGLQSKLDELDKQIQGIESM
jgi:hypothetical protein